MNITYVLVEEIDKDLFYKEIQDRINEGYDLQGGICAVMLDTGSILYMQAMVYHQL